MATRKKKRRTSSSRTHYNEITAIVFFAAGVLMMLCLVSSDPMDPSLNTASSQEAQNWIGIVGSVVADLLFQFVGVFAYALPVILLIIGFRFLFSKSLYTPPARILGTILFILSGSSLVALGGFYGGVTGAAFSGLFTGLLNTVGAGILLSALLLTSLVLLTNVSYRSFIESLGLGWSNFRIRSGEWSSKYKKMKAEHEKEVVTVKKKRPAAKPKILTEDSVLSKGAEAGNKISEKVSNVIQKLGEPPEAEEIEPPKILDEGTSKSEIKKEIPVSEDLMIGKAAAAGGSTGELVDGGKIPITPAKQTGDLTGSSNGKAKEKVTPEPVSYEDYELPKLEFLTEPEKKKEQKEDELLEIARELTEKTQEFNVTGQVKNIGLGPVVTTYEFKPDPGVKYSRVTGLVDDLCLALKAESIRIERIPGKAFVGIEVPNKDRETIFLRDVIDSDKFRDAKSPLSIALGKRIDGLRQVADLAKMPHLLIAGATGAGKSVGVNSLIVSILYKAKPDEVKFIMVDPKRLELGLYAEIPHLATPIITDPKRASFALKWAVSEMERRYKDLAGWGVRNIAGYNTEVERKNKRKDFDEDGNPHTTLPYVVIIIDELADLMMVAGKEVEESITRLAQMARAVGIHLVLATQRPSVDVITGLIKANFPSRISFRVSSKIDSRTIIDTNGAERLLGKGDMLFLPPASSHLVRVHGAYVDEKEIQKVVRHIKQQANPEYDETITQSEEEQDDFGDLPGRRDKLFGEALRTVCSSKRASTSLLQRHLRIGYGRAAAILDALVADGFIGEMDGSKRARPVLPKAYEMLQDMEEGREV
ncbi:MAG: DNA translocase FtsK [Pyrinomonadaceae bacterium]|nr:DNA translocase FtsK [Pyrinomonadaceae bacterium]